MKKYEEPKLEVEMLQLEDVITTSQGCADDCAAYVPCDWDGGDF